MALIAAHLNAGHSGGDSVAIGTYNLPVAPPPYPFSPFSPSLISLMVSVEVKHHVYLLNTRMTCIKMGSDESHFNVSLIVRDKVTRQCPQTTTFEEKGEPKRYRTEVLPLTSPTPYC